MRYKLNSSVEDSDREKNYVWNNKNMNKVLFCGSENF